VTDRSGVMRGPVRPEATLLGRLAGWCYDHRRRVLFAWIALLIGIMAIAQLVGTHFEDKFSAGDTPSQQALNLLQARFPSRAGDTADVVFDSTRPVRSGSDQFVIESLAARLRRVPHVVSVEAPVGAAGARLISSDGHIAYAVVQFDTTSVNLPASTVHTVVSLAEAVRGPGFDVQLGGAPISGVITAAPGKDEGIGVTAAIVIMLLAFGSVVAMGLPILIALLGLAIGIAVEELLTHLLVIPTFSPELAAMLGLGVGIDYALFIVTRYRRGLADGLEPREAAVTALATSGRAVLFAGSTVVISLLGLFLVGQAYLIGMSAGAICAVLFVLTGSLTLLPALLGYAGNSIDRLRVRRVEHGSTGDPRRFWYRWSRVVQRHPWRAVLSATLILVVLAAPLFSMRLAFTDAGNDPPSLTTRQAYDLLAQGFGPGANGPLVVAASLSGANGRPTVEQLAGAIGRTAGVASVASPEFNGSDTAAVIVVIPTTAPQAAATENLVRRLRADVIPPVVRGTGVVAEVGGETASSIDAAQFLSGRTFPVIAAVILLSFLLLAAVFRSVTIPVKAAVMNLLSIGAAYGVMVAVFQWGWLGGLIGIGHTGPIDPWIPLTMFTILFGLSMDYEMFLLSAIRENWRRTNDSSRSVADGLAVTARVITAAAAIMFCVFGSFVINDPLHILKVFGLGLAASILIDATLVRMVLVPGVMGRLGRANWWMPRWLDRIVPTLGIEADLSAPGADLVAEVAEVSA
jgi:putative drug exporter of the RND superfamily